MSWEDVVVPAVLVAGLAYGAGEWVWKRVRRDRPPDDYGMGRRVPGPYGDVIIPPELEARGITTGSQMYSGPSALLPDKVWDAPKGTGETRGRRVLVDRFAAWPKIYLSGTLEKPVVTLKARYASPASNKSAGRVALLAAFAFGFWLTDFMSLPPRYAASWWQTNAGAVMLGLFAGWVGFHAFRALFRLVLWRIPGWSDPLAMTFTEGGIVWQGEAQRRQWWRPNAKGRVLPTEPRKAEKLFPHRKAAQELRDNEERRLRGRKPLPLSRLVYQQCSEVLLFVGPDLESWRPVAELAGDEQGERAHRLASAINAADDLARGKGLKEAFGPGPAGGRASAGAAEQGTKPDRSPAPEEGGVLE